MDLRTVATQGRYGTVVFRYVPVTTNGRYDKLLAPNPIEITVKSPFLQFASKAPEINAEVKSPNLNIALRRG